MTYKDEMAVAERKTASERREDVLEAARDVFAEHGLSGASTDEIARRAGISQPYLFRLFRTKKELFIASIERCFAETRETFESAAEGKTGEEALHAMGEAYGELIRSNPNRLRAQMQTYAACGDPDVCAVARKGFGELVDAGRARLGRRHRHAFGLLRERDADQCRRLDGPPRTRRTRGPRRCSPSAWRIDVPFFSASI